MDELETKHCGGCHRDLPLNSFSSNKARYDGIATQCKDCSKVRVKDWYDKNKEKVNKKRREVYKGKKAEQRNRYLIRKYGITLDKYFEMSEKQNDVCKICEKPETVKDGKTGKIKVLAVDHCHETGRIRGLLCYRCNHLIGCLGDTEEAIERVLKYMKGDL